MCSWLIDALVLLADELAGPRDGHERGHVARLPLLHFLHVSCWLVLVLLFPCFVHPCAICALVLCCSYDLVAAMAPVSTTRASSGECCGPSILSPVRDCGLVGCVLCYCRVNEPLTIGHGDIGITSTFDDNTCACSCSQFILLHASPVSSI
jgi:hypothetical protein